MEAKYRLQRLTLLARVIQRNPYIALSELAREMERNLVARGFDACSELTLKRDLRTLREEFGLNIVYSRKYGGYVVADGGQNSPDVEMLIEPFELLNALNADGGVPDFILPEKHRPKGVRHLSDFIEAIRHSQAVEFRYSKYSSDEVTERRIAPYVLKETRGRWYVIGRESGGGVKTFGLDRIEDLLITSDRFERDPTFDVREKFRHSFGIYSSEEYPLEEVVLAFGKEDGGYLKSVPLHPSQEVVRETDTETVLKVRVRISPDFLMELLSRSWSLRVIAPESLRLRICSIYREALERNAR